MANIIDVAKFILDESARTSRPEVSTMKLQKICYFVQGWHLVINNGRPMFTEDFCAWKHGPVSTVLYDFCEDKVSVTTDSAEFANVTPELSDYQKDFIKKVFAACDPYTGLQLADMTSTHVAWQKAGAGMRKSGEDNLISKESIHNDFVTIMKSI